MDCNYLLVKKQGKFRNQPSHSCLHFPSIWYLEIYCFRTWRFHLPTWLNAVCSNNLSKPSKAIQTCWLSAQEYPQLLHLASSNIVPRGWLGGWHQILWLLLKYLSSWQRCKAKALVLGRRGRDLLKQWIIYKVSPLPLSQASWYALCQKEKKKQPEKSSHSPSL